MARSLAGDLVRAFLDYNDEFRGITRLARGCFERRDWQRFRDNAALRIELYDAAVGAAISGLVKRLGAETRDRRLWASVKRAYAESVQEMPDSAFFKTFFSSVTRRLFDTIGVDPDVEFLASDVVASEVLLAETDMRVYYNRGALDLLVDQLLADFRFSIPYRNRDVTIAYIVAEIEAYCREQGTLRDLEVVEMLTTVFYRSTRAFIVGRIGGEDWVSPLVLAMKNTDEGIVADAVIQSENDVSMLFGFTRSYFHADLDNVATTVGFLRRLMPRKPLDEIYTVLGRARQGKTERYRLLFRHLEHSDDRFVRAAGVRGMVMEVFTLPSYDVVFKLIRDRFDYPKTASREDVRQKYKLVFGLDRVGRLVDAQEFRRLRLPRARFEPALLDDLLGTSSLACRIDGDDVVLEHVYIERRLVPLNVYLESASEQAAVSAAIDYGQAVRDLALSNIFAGDLLLKNFGLTRHGRVIFYDYDELCLVTDCNFRHLPEARDDIDEMRAGAWFYVGPNDVFPEQFLEFLGFRGAAKQAFLDYHGELLTPTWWARLRKRHEAGEFLEVLPYSARDRTEHRGRALVPR